MTGLAARPALVGANRFPAAGAGLEVPAPAQALSTPVAVQVSVALPLPAGTVNGSFHCAGAGSASDF